MSHWKASKVASRATNTKVPLQSSSKKTFGSKKEDDEFDLTTTENDDDDSLSTHLLFPKESPIESKEPLFPATRKSFFMMTCKRTLFACRGLFLLCFIVFIVISLVSSHSGSTSSSIVNDSNSVSSPSSPVPQSGNISESSTINTSQRGHFETILLPPGISGKGNVSGLTVSFNENCTYRSSDYAVVGNALRKGLEFYEKNVDDITVLDAALGAKIVSEQLKMIQKSHQSLPMDFKSFLSSLEAKATVLKEQIKNTVEQASNTTDDDLKMTLPWIETEGLWSLPVKNWHPPGSLQSYNPPADQSFEELWNIAAEKEVIDESESDACIFQVFHCETMNVTEKCREVFLNVERSMYSLTHQVIYMLLAQKNHCYDKTTWKQVPVLSKKGYPFLEKLCGKVWQEANSIVEANFPPKFRDLFVEQVGMCALAGYSDFLRRDWLRRIVSWQSVNQSGCFGNRRRRIPATPTIEMLLREYQKSQQQEKLLNRQHKRYGKIMRYKRSDVILDSADDREKCSVHFTSVGITALSLHLRYFFDTCLDAY